MPFSRLLTGPDLTSLESQAFSTLTSKVGTQPESLLYLTQQEHSKDTTRDRWAKFGPPAALRIDTFDGFVSDCYEADQYKGRVTHIDRPLLFRLVELGVEGIESAGNPLHTGNRFPRSGLIQEAEALFTELEFAGLLSSDEMQDRLEAEGLPNRAAHIAELAESIEAARQEILADELPETYRTERMDHVTKQSTTLSNIFPSVDAVLISGFTRFDALERELLERITDTWPTVALVPSHVDTDRASGVDKGASQALETYRELGFSREFRDTPCTDASAARRQLTRSLYRHPEQSPETDSIEASELDLIIGNPETISDEIRDIARDIRGRLATGTKPGDIGVVLTSPVQYTDQIREVFETYEFPFSLDTETPLTDTAVGDAVQTICQLAEEPRTVDSLLRLLTNPLVAVTHEDGYLDHRELTNIASRVETNTLRSTLDNADDAVAATVESLIRDMAALSDASLESISGQLTAVLNRLGVIDALDGERDLSRRLRSREQQAHDKLERVLETLALTHPKADPTIGSSVDRLERALHGVSIREMGRGAENSVVVCGLGEALSQSFEYIYVLGLTSEHFPSDPEQTAFAQPIYESHPDFEQKDVTAEARYHLAGLLATDASLHLSLPQRNSNGDPYVEADILTELERLVDLSEVTVDELGADPGCGEDVQAAIGRVLGNDNEDRAHTLVDRAVEADTFDTTQETRIKAGIACAAARSSPDELTPYDGQLSPEMVSRVHDTLDREPYSASRLETYAVCGFKYYMDRVLGIDAPDPLTREPNALTRGSYIHDVLEHFYLSLQTREGEPIHPGTNFEARQESLLRIALDRLESAFDDYDDTAFHTEWLTEVLAGLGSPEQNPYYAPDDESESEDLLAEGLLYRFLEHEFDEPARTTARPTWFEARIGNPYDAGTPIQTEAAEIDTPYGSVPVYGLIDRVDTVPRTDPTQLVVRDYKTGGSIPSEDDALLGLKFQLPLYGLMAEDALSNVETVGGAYYQVAPPQSVNSRKGLLTSQEMAVYHSSDDVTTPLLRHSYPHFETHSAFREFIEETTPRRLGEITTAIGDGRFHPTVLDPDDAGCRYCDYAHVCDVRSHQRREVIDTIDDDGIPAYIPPKARGLDAEDILEVT